MDIKTKEMYSEVYSILSLMDEKYVKKIPIKLFELIKNNKLESYNPVYDPNESLYNQKVKKETVSMLILLKLNYWCKNENEKEEIRNAIKMNSERQRKIMSEKYSSENMFKQINEKRAQMTSTITQTSEIIEYKEESFFTKIIKKIKSLIRKMKI